MSGGGSILAMVVSISNNKKLLRRKSVFEKGRKLDDPEMTTYKNRHRPIEVKHLSDSAEELDLEIWTTGKKESCHALPWRGQYERTRARIRSGGIK